MSYLFSVPTPTMPSITHSPIGTITAGSPVTLTCSITLSGFSNYQSDSTVRVSFLRDGTIVRTNNLQIIGGSLKDTYNISFLDDSNVGNYKCNVTIQPLEQSSLLIASSSVDSSITTVRLTSK